MQASHVIESLQIVQAIHLRIINIVSIGAKLAFNCRSLSAPRWSTAECQATGL